MPQTEPVPPDKFLVAATGGWTGVLGRDMVAALLSREWSVREIALRRLARDMANALVDNGHRLDARMDKAWRCAADVVAKACQDKVFKV